MAYLRLEHDDDSGIVLYADVKRNRNKTRTLGVQLSRVIRIATDGTEMDVTHFLTTREEHQLTDLFLTAIAADEAYE